MALSRRQLIFVSALVSCLVVVRAPAQDVAAPAEFAAVRAAIEDGIAKQLAPSCAVAVIRAGEIVWAEGFGSCDLGGKRRATADSVYLLASVSKPLTATALMLLADEGAVDLAAPANRYLEPPGLSAHAGDAEGMTLRRLLAHISGLPTHWSFFYRPAQPPSMEETIRRYGFAARPPGTRWEYSNLGFGILQHVIERVAKTPYAEFLETRLFDPAGMTRSGARVRPGLEAEAATPCITGPDGKFRVVPPYDFDHPGASACWSSARDLARFLLLHLGDGAIGGTRLLREETVRAMREAPEKAAAGRYGLGWGLGSVRGRASFSHTGGMPGVATIVRGFAAEKDGYVVLTNAGRRGLVNDVAQRLDAILVPEPPAEAKKPAEPAKEADKKPRPAPLAGDWSGKLHHWEGDVALTLHLPAEGGPTVDAPADRGLSLQDVRNDGASFAGWTDSLNFATQDGWPGVPRVRFELRLEQDRLRGVAYASAAGWFNLPYWVELERCAPPPSASAAAAAAPAASAAPAAGEAPAAPRGRLVIVGGGSMSEAMRRRTLELAGGAAARVGVLPQASARPDAGQGSVEAWTQLGATSVRIVDVAAPDAADALRDSDLIWMPGGDQERLMDAIPAPVREAIRERFAAGAVVGGTSAGAAVMSQRMIAGDDDVRGAPAPNAKIAEGLGLWPSAIVDQHFSQRRRWFRLMRAVIEQPQLVGVGIDEGTAVIVEGRIFEVLGENGVTVMDARAAKSLAADSGAIAGSGVALHLLRAGMKFDLDRGVLER